MPTKAHACAFRMNGLLCWASSACGESHLNGASLGRNDGVKMCELDVKNTLLDV